MDTSLHERTDETLLTPVRRLVAPVALDPHQVQIIATMADDLRHTLARIGGDLQHSATSRQPTNDHLHAAARGCATILDHLAAIDWPRAVATRLDAACQCAEQIATDLAWTLTSLEHGQRPDASTHQQVVARVARVDAASRALVEHMAVLTSERHARG